MGQSFKKPRAAINCRAWLRVDEEGTARQLERRHCSRKAGESYHYTFGCLKARMMRVELMTSRDISFAKMVSYRTWRPPLIRAFGLGRRKLVSCR